MNIGKLQNIIQSLGLTGKKVEKTSPAAASAPQDTVHVSHAGQSDEDSVSLSLEGLIKQTTMELYQELGTLRQEQVKVLTDQINSGIYQVNLEKVAKAVINGTDAV